MSDYSFDIDHFLSDEEIQALVDECTPSLCTLNLRYAHQVDLALSYPTQPEYLDVIRTSWLLDQEADRPPHEELVKGLGLAFGMLLQQRTPLRWCSIQDTYGDFISMACSGEDPVAVSVPVFSYVERRETLQNAEVFSDFFKQVPADMLGV